jgi:hypothetical protein
MALGAQEIPTEDVPVFGTMVVSASTSGIARAANLFLSASIAVRSNARRANGNHSPEPSWSC